ncbi:MAG: DUF5915 domain-containing protein [Ilumatobacteraceae bacterium]
MQRRCCRSCRPWPDRLGKQVQQVIKAVKTGDWSRDGDDVIAGGVALHEGEFSLRLVPADEHASAALGTADGVVVLDLDVTPELEAEGLARDLVRMVQQARRDAGLQVSDRIALQITAPQAWIDAADTHRDLLCGEVLATALDLTTDESLDDPRVSVRVA